jgi:hypothetical protein
MMWWVALALAQEPDVAEVAEARRLSHELSQYSRSGRHDAVDRTYRRLLTLTVPVTPEQHLEAAGASLAVGDVHRAAARFARAGATDRLHDLRSRYGVVRVSRAPKGTTFAGYEPFAPDEQAALRWANEVLASQPHGVVMVPAGQYQVGGQAVQIAAGEVVSLQP